MYTASGAVVALLDYKFSDNIASSSFGPDVFRGSNALTFASSCTGTENFGHGHLMCYNCVKDMPQDWEAADCKAVVSESTVSSQTTFENAIITDNTIVLSAGFTVSSEIVILDVTGLKVNGAGFTMSGGYDTDIFGNVVSDASRVFYIANAGTELTIENLIFTNGYSSSTSFGNQYGGAIYIGQGVSIAISGCTFMDSYSIAGYGGGVALGRDTSTTGITVTLTSCIFTGNSVLSGGQGGGLFIGTGVIVTMEDCDVTSNVGAVNGGGISQYAASTATLTRVTFTSNSCSSYGGGYFNNGGATSVTSLTSCEFTSNTASTSGRGGGVSDDYLLFVCENTALTRRHQCVL